MLARLLPPDEIPWEALDRFADRTVFQTRAWLEFLAETQNAVPVVAELCQESGFAGYFTGLTMRRLGIRILGSSFPGWTTPYIGFNLLPGVSRRQALQAVETLAFGELKCAHLEVSDRWFSDVDGPDLGFRRKFFETYETDLLRSEDELFSGMESACRRCIRKAEKSGVRIEEAADPGFADDYYEQLKDVFGKQKLVPTYTVERVRSLIRHLLPTGRLLLVRALSAEGKCIGTGIYPGFGEVAEFWGNASLRSSQILRPNEALHWYALRYWKARGVKVFDWGGRRPYKEKFGPKPVSVPCFYKSRYRILDTLRDQAQTAVSVKQRILGRLRPAPEGAPPAGTVR
jgi:hypothetical protein